MRGRTGLIESIERSRVYALFVSVPYAALWARALLVEGFEPEAAFLVAAHALGVLTVVLVSDRVDSERDGVRGLALWKFPGGGERAASVALPVVGLLTLAAFLGLIAAAPGLGVCATTALLIGLWNATRRRARKYVLVEALAPMGALLLPLALLGVFAPTPLREATAGATVLGAVLFGLGLLLCVVRDQPTDALRGWSTTATRLGRAGAVRLAWAWIVAAVLLSAMGASWGWWGWIPCATIALAGAASGAGFARGAYERLVALWTLALWILGVVMLAQ